MRFGSFDFGVIAFSDDLEEPFTDSEDETPREAQKPSLVIPRGRIRTLSGTVPPTGYSPKWGGPTMCLSCLQFFDLPENIEKFAECVARKYVHLRTHRFQTSAYRAQNRHL